MWKVGSQAGGVEVETPETEPVRTLASLASALQKDASAEVRGQQFNSVFSTVRRLGAVWIMLFIFFFFFSFPL